MTLEDLKAKAKEPFLEKASPKTLKQLLKEQMNFPAADLENVLGAIEQWLNEKRLFYKETICPDHEDAIKELLEDMEK